MRRRRLKRQALFIGVLLGLSLIALVGMAVRAAGSTLSAARQPLRVRA
ncbi:MAG: hypothetical protein ABR583_09925 [Gaiellaceae bacterium]